MGEVVALGFFGGEAGIACVSRGLWEPNFTRLSGYGIPAVLFNRPVKH